LNFPGNSNRLLWVHRQMVPLSEDVAADIILTPQFYTMKKEVLPVKYAFQAKRIAPSLFDGLVEELHEQSYFVYKEEEAWVFIAYRTEEITAFLRSKGVVPEKIGKVFFAQQVADQIHHPLLLAKTDALAVLDGTVTVVPQTVLSENTYMQAEEIVPPKKGVHIEAGRISVLSRKQAFVVTLLFVLLGTVWFAEGWRYRKANRVLEEKQAVLYADYPALQNAYTRESIAEKYRHIDQAERKKREIVGKIAGMIFKGVTLTRFEMDDKQFKAILVAKDDKVARRLQGLIGRTGLKSRAGTSGREIVVEGTL